MTTGPISLLYHHHHSWCHAVVCVVQGRIPWDPMTMVRAMKNFNSSEDTVTVMDCADFHKIDGIKAASFFRG